MEKVSLLPASLTSKLPGVLDWIPDQARSLLISLPFFCFMFRTVWAGKRPGGSVVITVNRRKSSKIFLSISPVYG